jgi:Transposase DDE domain
MRREARTRLVVVELALRVCRRHLSSYSHPKSPRRYTQPQLMSCLILKTLFKETYRGITAQLELSDRLCQALGLERVPDHTTLEKFAARAVTPQLLDSLVGQVLRLCQEQGLVVEEVATDSTGMQEGAASAHYVARSGKRSGHYVKVSLVVACGSLLCVSMALSRGPTPDMAEAWEVLWRASGRCAPARLYADAAFDAEKVHAFCRDGWGASSFIPPVIKTRDGSIRTPHRAKMARLPPCYGRRWHAESFISGCKRVCSDRLTSRSERARLNEAGLKVLAYTLRR